jgi:hypothetical protein
MRFSIRDLLWLMAVVALGATLYAERGRLRRLTAQWEQLSEKQAQENAAALAKLRLALAQSEEAKKILQHQVVGHLEREQQRDASESATPHLRGMTPRLERVMPLPLVNVPDEAAN